MKKQAIWIVALLFAGFFTNPCLSYGESMDALTAEYEKAYQALIPRPNSSLNKSSEKFAMASVMKIWKS